MKTGKGLERMKVNVDEREFEWMKGDDNNLSPLLVSEIIWVNENWRRKCGWMKADEGKFKKMPFFFIPINI